jgi:hypothetical protein
VALGEIRRAWLAHTLEGPARDSLAKWLKEEMRLHGLSPKTLEPLPGPEEDDDG